MDEAALPVAFDFLAEQTDVDINHIAFRGGVEVVDVLPDVGPGDDFACVEGEIFEEGEFPAAEIDIFTAALDDSAGGVDLEIADAEDCRGGFVFPADHGADTGEEFGEDEWFDEIIIGAEFEAGDAILGRVLGGEEEDHGAGALFAKLTKDGEAIDFGQHDVEDDDIVPAVAGVPEGGLAIGGFVDGESGFAETLNEGFAKGLKIFDDEQSHE